LAAAKAQQTATAFSLDLLPQLDVLLKQLAVAGITSELLQNLEDQHGQLHAAAGPSSVHQGGHATAADDTHQLQAQAWMQDSSTAGIPAGEPPAQQQAGKHTVHDVQSQHSSSPTSHASRKLMQQDFAAEISVLSPTGLPDLEVLMSEDTSALKAFIVQQPTATAMDSSSSGGSSGAGGSGSSGGRAIGQAVNCFDLPIELCVALRRGNLQTIKYVYPYVLGYLVVAWDGLLQTLLAALSATPGQLVIDAQLVLLLLQQAAVLIALFGGLGIVITVDYLYGMVPM
jgi:hypothetical protein